MNFYQVVRHDLRILHLHYTFRRVQGICTDGVLEVGRGRSLLVAVHFALDFESLLGRLG